MAYISLYRKYRPQTFEDVVGQEHVTTTLRNAIRAGRVASGYLFTGTRGTAKTTCARILAKALNCIGPDGSLTTPTPEPCGVCGPCKSVAASSFVDVVEMDAASHRGIDDMRDIVSSIKFPPMEGRYKVYIIDEAHQLTNESKDAFLKTLEEPPDQVVFILATTEADRMPVTIQSRCQVYEFKRGSVAQISARLTEVLKAEGVQADAAAVTQIARAADGSYRDSLSLLEQVLAYERTHVTVKDVTVVLGTIDEDVLRQVVTLIADSDAAGAFGLAGTVLESGKDVRQFLKSLADRFRDMLFVGVGAVPASAGDLDDSQDLRAQAARFAPADLLKALETLTAAEQETKRSNQHRLILEMSLLRLMRLPSMPGGIPASQAAPPSPVPVFVASAPVSQPLAMTAVQVIDAPGAPVPAVSALAAAKPAEDAAAPDDMPPPLAEAELSDLDDDDGNTYALLPGDEDLDQLPRAIIVSAEDDIRQDEEAPLDDLLQVQQVASYAPPPMPVKPAPAADTPPELLRLQKSWQEVVNRMSIRPATAAFLREGEPFSLSGSTILVQFPSSASVDKLEGNERGKQLLEEAVSKTLGVEAGTYRVKAVLRGAAMPVRAPQEKAALASPPQAREIKPSVQERLIQEKPGPFVDEVIAVFGGRLLDDDEVTIKS